MAEGRMRGVSVAAAATTKNPAGGGEASLNGFIRDLLNFLIPEPRGLVMKRLGSFFGALSPLARGERHSNATPAVESPSPRLRGEGGRRPDEGRVFVD